MYADNQELQLTLDFVQYTGKNIFLTGKAGTGKTTFLRKLKELSPKRMIVVAPTGVAAINAGGTTIHSMFQLPFGPYLPEYQQTGTNFQTNRFSKEKINIIRSLDLLVIDEISMVRADLLDGIDAVLRRFRNRTLPFGGAQLLMIGDLHQLAPVAKEEEWNLLQSYYETPYFFSSRALSQTDYVSIELKQVYRQSDESFVSILNKIRTNCLDKAAIDSLNRRYVPRFVPKEEEGYITLTTHNYQAQRINAAKLNSIDQKPYEFKAKVDGEFSEYAYPTEYGLVLKKGAQVMFVKNDSSSEKRYFNGKIGQIVFISYEKIVVRSLDDDEEITVEPEIWENMKYEIDNDTKEIKESKIGSFTQYPLKTAWAITIHKSQGLTFERAIIDVNAAFSHGQVYVALSRCKSLEGLVLTAPLLEQSIINDQTVIRFVEEIENNIPTDDALGRAKTDYQFRMLIELFEFSAMQRFLFLCLKATTDHPGAFPSSVKTLFEEMSNTFREKIFNVAENFKAQIYSLSTEGIEQNPVLQDRVKKGAAYFLEKVREIVGERILNFSIISDNKQAKKAWNDAFDKLQNECLVKDACLLSALEGFDVKFYLQTKARTLLEEPEKKTVKRTKADKREKGNDTHVIPTDIVHPELFEALRKWRINKVSELGIPAYIVMQQKSLFDLMDKQPSSLSDLEKVNGFGKKKVEMYGEELLAIIREFRISKGLPVVEKNREIEF